MSVNFTKDERITILTNSLSDSSNATIAIEECSELIKEITKKVRNPERRNDTMVEEMADVLICLEILMYVYHISPEELDTMYETKMKRNLERK